MSCQQEVSMNHHSLRLRSTRDRIHLPPGSMEKHQSAMHSIPASAELMSPEDQCLAARPDSVVCWQTAMGLGPIGECTTH